VETGDHTTGEASEALSDGAEQWESWALLEETPAPVLVFAPDGRALMGNRAARSLLRLPQERIRGQALPALAAAWLKEDGTPISWDQSPEARVLRSGRAIVERLVGIERVAGGGVCWVILDAVPVTDRDGSLKQVVVTLADVTRRKHAEDALRREKDRAENYLAIAGSLIVALDARHRVSYINQAGCEALGYSTGELLGQDWIARVIPPEERESVKDIFYRLMAGECVGLNVVDDHQVLRSDGDRRWIVWHNTLVRDENGRIVGTLSSGEDVTERRAAEQRVKASLREKEVLLREIHHRVKNNLQVISSLLALEAHHHSGAPAGQLFADTQSRIRAMALVHDKLYQSENLAMIDLGTYIRDLAAGLKEVNASLQRKVSVVIEAEDIALTVDIAMSCGLLLNELLTNAFKYAFPQGGGGEIRVEARSLGSGQVRILISDNGIGLPANIDLDAPDTLGLQLVRAIAGQLQGRVAVERGSGSRFEITFPLSYGKSSDISQAEGDPGPDGSAKGSRT
jgi:PAS domain S-box-containing protein